MLPGHGHERRDERVGRRGHGANQRLFQRQPVVRAAGRIGQQAVPSGGEEQGDLAGARRAYGDAPLSGTDKLGTDHFAVDDIPSPREVSWRHVDSVAEPHPDFEVLAGREYPRKP